MSQSFEIIIDEDEEEEEEEEEEEGEVTIEEEEVTIEEEDIPEAIIIDGDTPTTKLQMESKIFLENMDMSRIREIVEEEKKAEKKLAKLRKIEKLNRDLYIQEEEFVIDGDVEMGEMEMAPIEITPITVDEGWILEDGDEDDSPHLGGLFKMRSNLSSKVTKLKEKTSKRVRFS